jgi:sugar phosphate isomerase/epimerase
MREKVSRREMLTLAGGATLLPTMIEAKESRGVAKDAKFQVGLVTYNVAKSWDMPTLIKLCNEAGYGGVELRTTHAHGVEVTLDAGQRKEVQKRFQEGGVRLWGLGTVCEFHSTEAGVVREQVESCKKWCELAKDVGAKGVKVRPNGLPKEVPIEKTLEQIGKALQECAQAAKDTGVEIWVEVHGNGTAHPPYMKKIVEICGRPEVGICWNSNPQDVLDGSVKPYFEMLKPWLRSCHINDLWGNYPYREFFALLRDAEYAGLTLCEVGSPVSAESGLVFLKCYHGLWRELGRQ